MKTGSGIARFIHEEEKNTVPPLKRGLSQIILGGQSLIADGVKLCREIGYEGFEILMTDGGELTPEAGEAEYREVRRIGETAGIAYTSLCGGGRQGRSLTADDRSVIAETIRSNEGDVAG